MNKGLQVNPHLGQVIGGRIQLEFRGAHGPVLWYIDGIGCTIAEGHLAVPTDARVQTTLTVGASVMQSMLRDNDWVGRSGDEGSLTKKMLTTHELARRAYVRGRVRIRGDVSVFQNFVGLAWRLLRDGTRGPSGSLVMAAHLVAVKRPSGQSLRRHLMRQLLRRDPRRQSDVFSVWRPISDEALRRMWLGEGVGKGLNIKGKSAQLGRLTGFVPFVQISDAAHKAKVRPAPPGARTRLYFATAAARAAVVAVLEAALHEARAEGRGPMVSAASTPVRRTSVRSSKRRTSHPSMGFGARRASVASAAAWSADDERLHLVDAYAHDGAHGIDAPQWLVWEAFVARRDIERRGEWATGRASQPELMAMNLAATRDASEPQPVVWQTDADEPTNPAGLVLAYQEARVRPVVSDFDAFLVGTRAMRYPPPPADQSEVAAWLLRQLEAVLAEPRQGGWMARWFDVLAETGYHPTWPPCGYGDPVSYQLFKHAITRLRRSCGGVRHGPEAFNYYFPQALDNEYLVLWDGFVEKGDGVPWRRLREPELRDFLHARLADGFLFPLNPKWVLCDPGWHELYQAIVAKLANGPGRPPPGRITERSTERTTTRKTTRASSARRAAGQRSSEAEESTVVAFGTMRAFATARPSLRPQDVRETLNAWFPASLRKEISAIRRRHPAGFQQACEDASWVRLESDVLQARLSQARQVERRGFVGFRQSLRRASGAMLERWRRAAGGWAAQRRTNYPDDATGLAEERVTRAFTESSQKSLLYAKSFSLASESDRCSEAQDPAR